MKYFIESGVRLIKDKMKQSPIYYTAREGNYLTCKYLIESGCELNEKDILKQTPIFYSAREGKLDICELLIQNGTDINIEDKYGQTCLFYAIKEGHKNIVELLINNKYLLNIIDKKKASPYSFAMKNGKYEIAALLKSSGSNINPNEEFLLPKSKTINFDNKLEDLLEDDNDKLNKYLLVKTVNGIKVPLNKNEIDSFKINYPSVATYLFDPKALENIEKEAPEGYTNIILD